MRMVSIGNGLQNREQTGNGAIYPILVGSAEDLMHLSEDIFNLHQ